MLVPNFGDVEYVPTVGWIWNKDPLINIFLSRFRGRVLLLSEFAPFSFRHLSVSFSSFEKPNSCKTRRTERRFERTNVVKIRDSGEVPFVRDPFHPLPEEPL